MFPPMIKQLSCVAAAVLASLVASILPASAHPHVWVTMRSELVYGPDGTITGIRHAWTFDDMFSAFATQGIDSKMRGVFTREELEPLAKTNVESLKDFEYFTMAKVNGKKADFVDPPPGYYLDYKDQILTLHFMLPFKTPQKAQELQIEIYDASYFVDFSFEKENAVGLVGAPAGCKMVVARPEEMDPATAAKLFQMTPDQKLDPAEFLGAQFANRILVKCS
jgi:ABC-type uncharacterized transport system substrate-binding protein